VVFQGLKAGQKEFITISPRPFLIEEGVDFLLEGFKSGMLSIIARDRGLGGIRLHRRRGIFFHPGVICRGGGFRAAGVESGGMRVSTPPHSAHLSTRHQSVGWKDSIDRSDKITNRRRRIVNKGFLKWRMKWGESVVNQ